MPIKTARKTRRMTLVPITVMEEVPILTAAERKALLKSLEEAEARAKAGQAIPYDSETFMARWLEIRRKAKRAKRA